MKKDKKLSSTSQIKIDPNLDAFRNQALFKNKLLRANKRLSEYGIPKSLQADPVIKDDN